MTVKVATATCTESMLMSRSVHQIVCLGSFTLSAAFLFAPPAAANLILVDVQHRAPSPSEQSAADEPVPQNSTIYSLRVVTDSDIISISEVRIVLGSGNLYNHSLGDPQNANSPIPAFIAVFPSLSADSYFDTPGQTTRTGPDLPGVGTTTFSDTTNDFAPFQFQFAQLTVVNGHTVPAFHFTINTQDTANPSAVYSKHFDIVWAEPTSAALSLSPMLALVVIRRRQIA